MTNRNNSSGTVAFNVEGKKNGSNINAFSITNDGKVAIGFTSTNYYALRVNGPSYSSNLAIGYTAAVGTQNIGGSNGPSLTVQSVSALDTAPVLDILNKAGTSIVMVEESGKFGIGTDNPSYLLQVGNAGDGSEARANAWNALSDKRLKTNITSIKNEMDTIKKLDGVKFDWKGTGKESIGFIAQDVEKVVPEIVSTGEDGYKSMDYSKLTALLIEGMKSQQNEIDALKKQVNQLKTLINKTNNQE